LKGAKYKNHPDHVSPSQESWSVKHTQTTDKKADHNGRCLRMNSCCYLETTQQQCSAATAVLYVAEAAVMESMKQLWRRA
jgi:hypothetical protein